MQILELPILKRDISENPTCFPALAGDVRAKLARWMSKTPWIRMNFGPGDVRAKLARWMSKTPWIRMNFGPGPRTVFVVVPKKTMWAEKSLFMNLHNIVCYDMHIILYGQMYQDIRRKIVYFTYSCMHTYIYIYICLLDNSGIRWASSPVYFSIRTFSFNHFGIPGILSVKFSQKVKRWPLFIVLFLDRF